MTIQKRCLSAVALLSFTAMAHATPEPDLRPTLSGMYNHIFEDSIRGSDEGSGATLGLGWNLSPVWGVELGGFFNEFDNDPGKGGAVGDWREWGGNLDVLYHLSRNPRFTPYTVLGAGAIRLNERNSNTFTTEPFAHVGVGFKSLLTSYFGIRGDARYRYVDVSNEQPINDDQLGEAIVSLGFFVPLGSAQVAAAPTPTPPPATPVPATPTPTPPPPKPTPTPEPEVIYEIDQTVLFEFDSAKLRPQASPSLMEAARKINQDTTLERVEVGGHTCDLGPAPYNKTLSERRASAVADFLVKQGNVPPAKLTVRGYGMDKPKVPNNSNENRERNRRVELTVLKRSQ
jgi:OmpA-OmpF porin, OOP family